MALLPLAMFTQHDHLPYASLDNLNIFDPTIDFSNTRLDERTSFVITESLIASLRVAIQTGSIPQFMNTFFKFRSQDALYASILGRMKRSLKRVWREGHQSPKLTFTLLENEMLKYKDDQNIITWWEPWIPTMVALTALYLANWQPYPSAKLVLAFGHDTDTYLQVLGGIVGALWGEAIFVKTDRLLIKKAFYQETGSRFSDFVKALTQKRF